MQKGKEGMRGKEERKGSSHLVFVWRRGAGDVRWTRPCRSYRRCWLAAGRHGCRHSQSSPPCWRCGGCAWWAWGTPQTCPVWSGPRKSAGTQPHTAGGRGGDVGGSKKKKVSRTFSMMTETGTRHWGFGLSHSGIFLYWDKHTPDHSNEALCNSVSSGFCWQQL